MNLTNVPNNENPEAIQHEDLQIVTNTTDESLKDALQRPLSEPVQKRIEEIEKEHGITLPKPGEYWKKETFNQEGYRDGHYLSISYISSIDLDDYENKFLRFYCDRVKTTVFSEKRELLHQPDTRGTEEVIGWCKRGILKKTTKEEFDKYADEADEQSRKEKERRQNRLKKKK